MTGYLTLNANPTNNLHAATKAYVDSTSTEAINAVKQYTDEKTAAIVTDIWSYGSTAPSNKKLLWIDSNATTGGLKFYKNTTDGWVHVPVAWQ